MKIAAAYIRVSTDDQIEYSPSSQLEKIREYAKRNDYILPDEYIFIDEGISGRHTQKRAGFNKMIGIAKTKPKPFDAILLWKFSRFARNREDSIVYKSMLRKQCGIDVISISENVGDDKMSVLIEALIEAMDEYYSINLAEEVRRGMTEKANRGEPLTNAPFGYSMENGNYIPNPETAPVIQRIFNDYLNGKGMREIAVDINNEGYRTIRGNCFENRTIQYILNNPVYIGKIRWTPTGRMKRNFNNPDTMIIQGTHEPIIDIDTWNAVQNKLKTANKTKYMRDKPATNPFMLQGLVRCSACGSTLCHTRDNSIQCHSYAHGKCTVSHSISLRKINAMVLNALEKSAATGDFKLEIQPKNTSNPTDTEIILNQIDKEKKKLDRIKDAYENGIYTLDEFKESRKKINDTIEKLSQKIAETKEPDEQKVISQLQHKIIDVLPALRSPAVTEIEKNSILKSFIRKIIFYRATEDIDVFFYA